MQYWGPFFLPLNLFSSRYMLILYFQVFSVIFQASMYVASVAAIVYYDCITVNFFFFFFDVLVVIIIIMF